MTIHPPTAPEAIHARPSDQSAHTDDADAHAANTGRDSPAPPATTPTAGRGTPAETGRQTAPASRGTPAPLTRDALDADLATAVRHTARIRQAFYILVLLVALVGQVTGAVDTLGITAIVAIPAVAALELGGVVVMANADVRRRLGEQAIASRLLSAAIAAAAVTFNWAVHPDHLVGGFYAGMSALGYLVWLMHAGNQRRDRLRATGDLPPTPPTYEVLGHWIRHPAITSRARTIAKTNGLNLYESLQAARAAITRERRDAAIATVLHRKIRAAVDTTTADIAVRVYDLDEIAARLAATADYHKLTMLLAADLAPERIIPTNSAGHRRGRWCRRDEFTTAPLPPATTQPVTGTPRDGHQQPKPEPGRNAKPAPNDDQRQPAESHDGASPRAVPLLDEPTGTGPAGGSEDGRYRASDDVTEEIDDDQDAARNDQRSEAPRRTAEAVAYWLGKEPNIDPELLAERIGKSLRSVYRYLPPDYPRRPGVARQRARRKPGPTRRPSRSE